MPDTPMRILGLKVSNIMGIKAVDMTPNPTLQVISGKNGNGKTSVLRAIQFALENADASKIVERPLRNGTDKGEVIIDLGDLIVKRTFNKTKTGGSLIIKNKDGKTLNSPQEILDKLTGKMGFDPFAFSRKTPKEQRDILLSVVDIHIDVDKKHRNLSLQEFEELRKTVYEKRADINRDIRSLGTPPEVDDTLPGEETSADDIIKELSEASLRNQDKIDETRKLNTLEVQRADLQDQIDLLRKRLDALTATLAETDSRIQEQRQRIESMPEETDIESLKHRLETINEFNQSIRENNERRETLARISSLSDKSERLTAILKVMDSRKDKALQAAEFPIEGLSVDDEGVLYNGVPYVQASTSERLRVAVAIAMATNPVIRVIHIDDGESLDEDNMRVLDEMLKKNNFQAFVSRVGDTTSPGAIIIEDGEIAGTVTPSTTTGQSC